MWKRCVPRTRAGTSATSRAWSSNNPVPTTTVYSSPPMSIPVGNLNCGDRVQVLGRRESWLRISSTTGERYVPMTTLSQRKDRFVAIDFPLPLEPRSQYNGTVLPRPIYAPKAEYTQDALKAGIHGSIILKVTIAVDGSVRDVTPFVRLGYGLDESAVKAV